MIVRIYDVENLLFGCKVSVKATNKAIKKAIVIKGAIAFEDGVVIDIEKIYPMEVYLGW